MASKTTPDSVDRGVPNYYSGQANDYYGYQQQGNGYAYPQQPPMAYGQPTGYTQQPVLQSNYAQSSGYGQQQPGYAKPSGYGPQPGYGQQNPPPPIATAQPPQKSNKEGLCLGCALGACLCCLCDMCC